MLARILATWFGCGLVPFAPGTAGSFAAILLALPVRSAPPWVFGLAALILFPVAVWSADSTARQVGREDPGLVVVDEVAGQWIALTGATHLNWRSLALAFFLFRLFDIWKPWPTRRLEKLPGGWGIVADDCMAGVYAAIVLMLCGPLHLP
ncbi:MAG: phosphatidylglycerophosphatase A [Acidobacteriota bacterium]|nr:phosphatidylglycerophosphatase A [Acidobacteriota bacterium]